MRRSVTNVATLAALLALHASAPAGMPGSASATVIGPRALPPGRDCTMPIAGSLVSGVRTAAYLQVCSRVAEGHPTTLVVADVPDTRVRRTSYQLSVLRPHLLSVDGKHVRWLQMGPPSSLLSDRIELAEFDLETGRISVLDEVRLPFKGSVVGIARGDGCWLGRVRGGPDATRRTALVLVSSGRLQQIPTSDGEHALFWDAASAGFVLGRGPDQTARAVDSVGRSVPVSRGATTLLAMRKHLLDRYWSLPEARAVAIDPLGDDAEQPARLMQAAGDPRNPGEYEARGTFPRIHAVADDSSGSRMAVVTTRSVEVISSQGERRSFDISDATGWNTQIEFLKDRPVLIVLDDRRMTAINVER